MPAFAALQNGDLLFSEEGQVIFVDGANGAPLHVQYIGKTLTHKIKVKVTPDDPELRLTPNTCTFSPTHDSCAMTIHLANPKNKVYGVHTYTVTEVGAAAVTSGSGETTSPVTFAMGLTEKGAPEPVVWNTKFSTGSTWNGGFSGYYPKGSSPFILVNATQSDRLYSGRINVLNPHDELPYAADLKNISVPAGGLCFLDNRSVNTYTGLLPFAWASNGVDSGEGISSAFIIKDITDGSARYNSFAQSPKNYIGTCVSVGIANSSCSSRTSGWPAMTVGLANLGGEALMADSGNARDHLLVGQVKAINPRNFVYWQDSWVGKPVALLQIQGNTDGSAYDPQAVAPNIEQIKSAPPCSNYIQP